MDKPIYIIVNHTHKHPHAHLQGIHPRLAWPGNFLIGSDVANITNCGKVKDSNTQIEQNFKFRICISLNFGGGGGGPEALAPLITLLAILFRSACQFWLQTRIDLVGYVHIPRQSVSTTLGLYKHNLCATPSFTAEMPMDGLGAYLCLLWHMSIYTTSCVSEKLLEVDLKYLPPTDLREQHHLYSA